ncbi:hypothetical protein L4C36_05695 [Photobacterium japonica]|uniref:hypothetical protein n=1 Tax=Photobacterium japonica TaxID=2910235 RepID=UPI003D13D3BE
MTYCKQAAGLLVLAALLGGCSTTPEGQQSAETTFNTEDVLQAAQHTHRFWRDILINAEVFRLYAPDKYVAMMESWLRADSLYRDMEMTPETAQQSYSLFSSETYLDRFNAEIAIVDHNYQELEYLQRVANDVLKPAMTQMDYLTSIDASDHYHSEFARLDRFYASLFSAIAKGDVSKAKDEQVEFLSRAQSLEVRVIKRIYIAPQERALRELRRQDVRYLAPLSYAKVEAEINTGKSLIDQSPRAFDAISQVVTQITFELAHAEHMAAAVKALRDRSRDEYESYLLDVEAQMLAISQALNDTDLRDRSLAEQGTLIRQQVSAARQEYALTKKLGSKDQTQDQLEGLQALIRQQNDKIADLQSQLSAVVVEATMTPLQEDAAAQEALPVVPATVSERVVPDAEPVTQ